VTITRTDVRQTLLARAAVALTFDPEALIGGGVEADDIVQLLNEDCELVVTPSGVQTWTLRDDTRRQALARLPLGVLRDARDDVVPSEMTATQRALDRSLRNGWSPEDLLGLSVEDARALSAVAQWWQGHNTRVPDLESVAAVLDRLNLFSDVREMAGDHFVGRRDILSDLRKHVGGSGPAVFGLHGIGGMGKSALLARHVVWALDKAHATVARVDFDDPTLNAYYSLDVLGRIVRLVAQQSTGDARMRLERLAFVAEDAAGTSGSRSESSSRALVGGDLEGSAQLVKDLVGMVERRILVVFDTLEQVQRRGDSAVYAFADMVQQLSVSDALRIVVAGRAEVPELEIESHELRGLQRDEARVLLLDLCKRPLSDETASLVLDGFGTSPLTVRLVARLLSDDTEDDDLHDLLPLDLHTEHINAVLYRRVLKHIRDPQVHSLAHPGLVLRRVTPELIWKVLARPCGIRLRGEWEAFDLFHRLSLEAMLVERSRDDADVLVHRRDIRSVMLPQLLSDETEGMKNRAARIQRSAVRYYSARDDLTSRTEELYHRLLLGQSAHTIRRHWDDKAGREVYRARDELSTPARIILSQLLDETYLQEEDRQLVSDSAWVREIEPQVRRLVARQSWGRALELLRERRGPRGQSLLPSLAIDVLEGLGRVGEAMDLAKEHRRLAALANDATALTSYTLDLVRLAERAEDFPTAETTLTEALASVRQPTTDRLRLLVALLGFLRRRRASGELVAACRQEAIDLYETLGVTRVRVVPGLLRDLAAETGAEHHEIQDAALRSIGIDASIEGDLPDALRSLDDATANPPGEVGDKVADLTQLDSDDDGVRWSKIANKPRGETGRLLLNVLQAFPTSADGVRNAVASDYQNEADAALLGRGRNLAHKA